MWRMQVEQLDSVANIDNLLAMAANVAPADMLDARPSDTLVSK